MQIRETIRTELPNIMAVAAARWASSGMQPVLAYHSHVTTAQNVNMHLVISPDVMLLLPLVSVH